MIIRCSDNDFSIDEFLVKLGVLAILVRGGNESMPLVLEPFSDAKLVLGRA